MSKAAQSKNLTISQAAKLLGVTPNTLRNWEAKGLIKSHRTKGGQRRYTSAHLKTFNIDRRKLNTLGSLKQRQTSKPAAASPSVNTHESLSFFEKGSISQPYSTGSHTPIQADHYKPRYQTPTKSKRLLKTPPEPKKLFYTFGSSFLAGLTLLTLVATYQQVSSHTNSIYAAAMRPIMQFKQWQQDSKQQNQIDQQQKETLVAQRKSFRTSILAASDLTNYTSLDFDINTKFKQATFFYDTINAQGQVMDLGGDGELIAPNVIYSLTSGTGISITGDQDLTITADLPNTFASVTIEDNDTLSAGSTSDTLSFKGTGGVTLSLDGNDILITSSTDAETLDSIDSASFLRSDTSDEFSSGALTFAANTLLDLSNILQDGTAQGLKLPQAASLSPPSSSEEGYIAYNTSSQQLQVFNGASWGSVGSDYFDQNGNFLYLNDSDNSFGIGGTTAPWGNNAATDSKFYFDAAGDTIVLEGATSNGSEIRLVIEDPAADQTITIPGDATGEISLLGQSITPSEIDAINSPTDGYVLKYDNATGRLEWATDAGGSGSTSLFSDGGTYTYLTSTTDDLMIGSNITDQASFFFDVSTGNITLEGSIQDAYETTLQTTNPTADRTIVIPNASGTIALDSDLHSAVSVNPGSYTYLSFVAGTQTLTLNQVDISSDTNLTGTLDRITLTGDTLDIAATYTGQGSITTLGTITSGTWNGTALTDSYVSDAITISSAGSVDSTALTDGGTISFDWVDAEVSDSLTIDGTGSVADGALSANVAHLNIAETISENWINTANPWADNEVVDALTISSGTIDTTAITLLNSINPTTTTEGYIEWDSDDNVLIIGDGATTQIFYPGTGAGMTDTNASTECAGDYTYLDGEGNCDDLTASSLAYQTNINNDDWSGTDLAIVNGGTGASDALNARANLGLAIGTDVQAYDAGLQSISGLTTAADQIIYTTASDTYATTSLTTFIRTLLDDANQAAAQATLGVVPGTDVQAYDADLSTIAGLSSVDSNFIVGSAGGWVVESGNTARTSLGLGSADSPTFANINTGQGAYELYAMDQDVQTTDSPSFVSLTLSGAADFQGAFTLGGANPVTAILDEDDLSSDSDTALATQQSIKAYVDAQVGGASALPDLTDTNTSAYSNAQILVYDGTTDNAWENVAMSGDVNIDYLGATTIQADAVALGTDTTGNYVATITAGAGLTGDVSSEGSTPTLAVGTGTGLTTTADAVSFDFSATLSGDHTLSANEATFGQSGIIFEGSAADTFETYFAITNPTVDRTFTFPDNTGTILLDNNGLSALTTSEVDQLENINATTISTTQWGYLGALDQGLTTTSAVTFTTIDTGNGAMEVNTIAAYLGDQDLQTTDAPTFATLNTGQGAYELYAMDQDVQTTDSVSFNSLTLSGTLTANGGAITRDSGSLTLSTTTSGDLSLTSAGELYFSDNGATNIPLTLTDTSLNSFDVGDRAIVDALNYLKGAVGGSGGGVWTSSGGKVYPSTLADSVGIGTTTSGDIISSLYVTHDLSSGATGKALAIFNQTEDQDLLTASDSGNTRLSVTQGGALRLHTNSYYTGFQPSGSLSENIVYTLPTADASSANQVLASDGAGSLTWIDVSAGSGGFTNWTLTGDSGSQTIDSGNTVLVAGGSNITTAVTATDTVTINLDGDITIDTATFSNGGAIRTNTTASDTLLIQAYDVDGASYITFGTLTAGNTPTFDLASSVTIGGNAILDDTDIGTSIQGYDADLTTIAGLSSADSNFIVGSAGGWVVESGDTVRTSLGLGSADAVTFATVNTGQGANELYAMDQDVQTSDSPIFAGLTLTGDANFQGAFTLGGANPVTEILDEDAMTSNSPTALATQQSIKAYVDAQVSGADQLSELTDTNTTAYADGQILVYDGTTDNAWENVAMSGDIAIDYLGVTTIQADAVALGTDTTGNYVATITAGAGLTGDVSVEGATPTLAVGAGSGISTSADAVALGPLTANWDQTGAFDIVLNNAGSELQILESAGATYYGTLDVGDLNANRNYTLPDSSGTILLDNNGLSALTTAEVDQLENINTTTISTTQWGYLGALDQGLTTTSDPTFGALTVTTLNTGQGAYELYAMDQNVRTSDSPTFAGLTLSGAADFQGAFTLGGANPVTAILDEDNMASDSVTALATQQSIKAYVDSRVASADTLEELSDTNISGAAAGQLLIYDGTDSWDNITISGDVSFDFTGATVIQANAVALGTDTTGNYVATITAGSGLTGDVSSEGSTPTLAVGAGTGISVTADAVNFDYSSALSGNHSLNANEGIFGQSGIIFEGSVADDFETYLAITNPTADRTFTFPDNSGTILLDNNGLSALTTAEVNQLENIDSTSISTTQWGYLGAFDQGLTTTSAVTFTTLNTGQGAYELYAMDQNVQIADAPTFAGLTLSGNADFNGSFTLGSGVGVSTILDEDDLISESATALATQQSIKAYVDNQITSTTYWENSSGVLQPAGGEVLAATSSATTVATFTATGTNNALRAGGSSNYLTIDASGNLNTSGTLTAATNETINGIDINSGAISDVVSLAFTDAGNAWSGGNLDVSGIISGDTLTDGTASLTSGALTGLLSLAVDNLRFDGTAIGLDTDADLLQLAADSITINGATTVNGQLSGVQGISSTGNIDFGSLSAGGLVKAAVTTGRLQVATSGTDYEPGLTFQNGLTRSTNTITLGGTLTQDTTISQTGTYSFTFSNAGSGNTAINLSSTGDFEVQDSGTAALHVSGDSGNVGIGNNNPTNAKLDVTGDAYISTNLTLGNNFTTATGNLISTITDGASANGFTFNTQNDLTTTGAKLLSVQNNGTEAMYVDKDGNLYVTGNIISGNGTYIITLTNKSGSVRSVGDLVVIDTANDSSFTTTTLAYNKDAFGIVVGGDPATAGDTTCSANETCQIAVKGKVTVNVNNAVSRGDYIFSSTNAGYARSSGALGDGVIGVALTADALAPYQVTVLMVPQLQSTGGGAMFMEEGTAVANNSCVTVNHNQNTDDITTQAWVYDTGASEWIDINSPEVTGKAFSNNGTSVANNSYIEVAHAQNTSDVAATGWVYDSTATKWIDINSPEVTGKTFSNSGTSVADGSYITVNHAQATNDLTATGWVKNGTTWEQARISKEPKVASGRFDVPGSTGNYSVTGLSFQPDMVEFSFSKPSTTGVYIGTGQMTASQQSSESVAKSTVDIGTRVYRGSSQTIPNATGTVINFTSENYDTDSIHDNSTNNTRLTATTAGKYLITCSLDFTANGTGIRAAQIKLDGSSTFLASTTVSASSATIQTNTTVTTVHQLNAGQYVECSAYQNSGGNLDVRIFNGSPTFEMHRLSDVDGNQDHTNNTTSYAIEGYDETDTVDIRASRTSFNSDGFTINFANVDTTWDVSWTAYGSEEPYAVVQQDTNNVRLYNYSGAAKDLRLDVVTNGIYGQGFKIMQQDANTVRLYNYSGAARDLRLQVSTDSEYGQGFKVKQTDSNTTELCNYSGSAQQLKLIVNTHEGTLQPGLYTNSDTSLANGDYIEINHNRNTNSVLTNGWIFVNGQWTDIATATQSGVLSTTNASVANNSYIDVVHNQHTYNINATGWVYDTTASKWIDINSPEVRGKTYTQSGSSVANNSYIEIAHNQNTTNPDTSGWVYDATATKWIDINSPEITGKTYSQQTDAVADGSYITVNHAQNTNDLTATGWVKNGATWEQARISKEPKVASGRFDVPGSTGNYSVTGLTFQPDMVEFSFSKPSTTGVYIGTGQMTTSQQSSESVAKSTVDIGARVYRNSSQTLPSGTITPVAFNVERFDTDNIHSTVSNTTRLTAQTAGKYIIEGSLAIGTSTAPTRQIGIYYNGTAHISASMCYRPGTTSTNCSVSTIYYMNAGDYVELWGYQDSGSSTTIDYSANFTPEFSMYRLGDSSGNQDHTNNTTSYAIEAYDETDTVDIRASRTSFNSNGFTLNFANVDTTWDVSWTAYGSEEPYAVVQQDTNNVRLYNYSGTAQDLRLAVHTNGTYGQGFKIMQQDANTVRLYNYSGAAKDLRLQVNTPSTYGQGFKIQAQDENTTRLYNYSGAAQNLRLDVASQAFQIKQVDANTIRMYNYSGSAQNVRLDVIAGGVDNTSAGTLSLAPSSADTDTNDNTTSLWVNKTGTNGNLIRMQEAGTNRFLLTKDGSLTITSDSPGTSALIVDQTSSADILTASASGATRLRLTNAGDLTISGDATIQGGDITGTNGAAIDLGEAVSGDVYINTDLLLGATAETLSNASFIMDGNDLFVADSIGVEGNVYTDGSFIAGSTLTLNDDYIRDSSIINLQPNADTDDYFTFSSDGTDLTFASVGAANIYIKPTGNGLFFQNAIDATTGVQFLDADGGTPILNIDTTNERVGIGLNNPSYKLDITGTTNGQNMRINGEIIISDYYSTGGQVRMIGGNYGAMWRNDGTNTYFLLTNSADQYGTWNSLRPLYINNSSGNIYLDSGTLQVDAASNLVGINKAPSQALDVSGNIDVTGTVDGVDLDALAQFKIKDPYTEPLYLTNQSSIAWTDLDLTAHTSSNTIAASLRICIYDSDNNVSSYIAVRKNGSSEATARAAFSKDAYWNCAYPVVATDTNEVIEYYVANNDASDANIVIDVLGYWESVNGADVAEYYATNDNSIDAGTIVSIDKQIDNGIEQSTRPYDQTVIGIVPTKPSIILNQDAGAGPIPSSVDYKALLALAGRVPVKVTSQNGIIQPGDPITTSDLTGFGMKSIKAGAIVAKAIQTFDPSTRVCKPVESVNKIVWPYDSGENSTRPCFRLPDGTYVGKAMAFVNVSYHDPSVYLTESGEINIEDQTPQEATQNPVITLQAKVGQLEKDIEDLANSYQVLANNSATMSALLQTDPTDIDFTSVDQPITFLNDTIFGGDIFAYGTTALQDTYIRGTATILPAADATASGNLELTTNTISAIDSPLYFQSTGLHGIDFLNGKVTINEHGDMYIAGDLTVKGTITAHNVETNTLTASSSAVLGDTTITGLLTASPDNSGTVTVAAGETIAQVLFSRPFQTPPIVNLTPKSNVKVQWYWVNKETPYGFEVEIDSPQTANVTFNWMALGNSGQPTQAIPAPDASPSAQPVEAVIEPVPEPTLESTPTTTPAPDQSTQADLTYEQLSSQAKVVTIPAGETRITVSFGTRLTSRPDITVIPDTDTAYLVENINPISFDITLEAPAEQDINFAWSIQ